MKPDLTPVDSTLVAAAGWDDGIITIQFRDGAIYQQMASESTYTALLEAPSKGKFVRAVLTSLKRIAPNCTEPDRTLTGSIPVSFDSEVTEMFIQDTCCTKHFIKASHKQELDSGEWECPKCGTVWQSHLDPEASVRSWTPKPAIDIIRLRG